MECSCPTNNTLTCSSYWILLRFEFNSKTTLLLLILFSQCTHFYRQITTGRHIWHLILIVWFERVGCMCFSLSFTCCLSETSVRCRLSDAHVLRVAWRWPYTDSVKVDFSMHVYYIWRDVDCSRTVSESIFDARVLCASFDRYKLIWSGDIDWRLIVKLMDAV